MLETTGLIKDFPTKKGRPPVRAVNGVSFAVQYGETMGLLGPNGAGKTTTMRLLLGLLSPTAGDVQFEGKSVFKNAEEARSHIGIVTETAGLYDRLRSSEYLEFFARMYGMEKADYVPRMNALMDRFGLTEHANKRIGSFSKGMKQKVNLVRAILHKPKLLLLDEPTSGLDPEMTEKFWEVLSDLMKDRSVAIILCTHNLDEADRLCDRVAIMIQGRIVREGQPDRLKSENSGDLRKVRVVLRTIRDEFVNAARSIDGVQSVASDGECAMEITSIRDPNELNPLIARTLVMAGADLVSMQAQMATLREVYLKEIGGTRK